MSFDSGSGQIVQDGPINVLPSDHASVILF